MFKFFQNEARFPNNKNEIPKAVIQYIAKQVEIASNLFNKYGMNSRSYYYHKSKIRDFLGFSEII